MSYRPSDLLRGSSIPDAVLWALPKTDLHATLAPEPALADLQTAARLEQAAGEAAARARAAGVRVLELRVCPDQHQREGLTAATVLDAVQRGLAAGAGTALRAGTVVVGRRTDSPLRTRELARLAVSRRGAGVVAFGLGGQETGHPADEHREAFYHAKNNNLPSTCDASPGDGAASIHAAIHRCGALRIGHALRLQDDPDLFAFVNDHRIPLEVCLSSEVKAAALPEPGGHPLRRFHEAGLRICLNTGGAEDLGAELRLAADTFDFTLLELEDLLLGGFKSAFLPEREARSLIESTLADFARLRDHHRLDALVAQGGPA